LAWLGLLLLRRALAQYAKITEHVYGKTTVMPTGHLEI